MQCQTVNFQDNVEKHLAALADMQPDKPLMVSEFWSGWFDHWGEKHHSYSGELLRDRLRTVLALNASFNLYVFHGGTTFGWLQGANHEGRYGADITSYDYDAIITESGAKTNKFDLIQELLRVHGATVSPFRSLIQPPVKLPSVTISHSIDWLQLLATAQHAFPGIIPHLSFSLDPYYK